MMKDSCYKLFFTPLNVWEPAYFIHCILNRGEIKSTEKVSYRETYIY